VAASLFARGAERILEVITPDIGHEKAHVRDGSEADFVRFC
jgi:hypothetical protein